MPAGGTVRRRPEQRGVGLFGSPGITRLRAHTRLAGALTVALIVGSLAAASTTSAAATTPADAAATHTYLLAVYELDTADLRGAAATVSASAAFAARIGGECRGALAGAPSEREEEIPEAPSTPRARGERELSEHQDATIEDELTQTFDAAQHQPERAAIEAFVARVTPLSWSDPRIAVLVHDRASEDLGTLAAPTADLCADLRTWQQSGYHQLSATTRAFGAKERAEEEVAHPPDGSPLALLKGLSREDRELIRRSRALAQRFLTTSLAAYRYSGRLARTLGEPEGPEEEREHEQVLGRGRTAAPGETFVVRRVKQAGGFEPHCRLVVAVEFRRKLKNGLENGESGSRCLSRTGDRRAGLSCGGDFAELSAAVPVSVWSVRLGLSNGRTITTPVVRIPAHDGGPAGVYAQALHGYKPYAVSLTELDRHGRVVHVIKLQSSERCRAEPKGLPVGPQFSSVADGTTPAGEPFTIEGVLVRFGEGHGQFYVELAQGIHQDGGGTSIGGSGRAKAYAWSLGLECEPHPWAIVYGLLAPPGASVLARTPEGLVPLTKVELAAGLNAEGPLLYGVFASVPSELIVRRGDGSTLYTEDLTKRAHEEQEFCEGYVEA